MTKQAGGFSLLELMITVAIIGILAAIAIPNYNSYVLRGNRTLAKTTLTEIASRQESFFTDRKTYATTLSALGYPADTFYFGKPGTPSASPTGAIYSVTLGAYTAATVANCSVTGTPTATTFAIVATPLNAQAKDMKCGKICMGSVGDKGAAGSDGSNCWTR